MRGGGVDAATLVAALGASPPPPECRWGRRPHRGATACRLTRNRSHSVVNLGSALSPGQAIDGARPRLSLRLLRRGELLLPTGSYIYSLPISSKNSSSGAVRVVVVVVVVAAVIVVEVLVVQ